MIIDKRGEMNLVTVVLVTIIALFIGAFGILTLLQGQTPSSAVSSISGFTTDVLVPVFGWLLNLNNAGDNAFLMVLAFILMMVIVSSTLDAANIFGAGSSISENRWLNLIIGVIVSIIGVRFMPADVWGSLTAPSSALVATVLVGIPFVALFLLSMKVKSVPARKVLWLFYLVFMSYLVLRRPENYGSGTGVVSFFQGFAWVYIIFMALAGLMLAFDGTVQELFYREKSKVEMAKVRAGINLIGKGKLIKRIVELQEIVSDPNQPKALRDAANVELKGYTTTYGDLAADG